MGKFRVEFKRLRKERNITQEELAHALGMPDAVIMASGGWKTDDVMKRIYRHEKQDQVTEMQKKYAAQFHDNI